MQTYFDLVDIRVIADLASRGDPDALAAGARWDSGPVATTYALASIRARGNWMLVNGQWHKRG